MVYFVWLGHKLNYRNRTRITILLSLVIALASALAFSFGCMFVKTVWLNNNEYTGEHFVFTFFAWLALCALAHAICYRLTKRKLAEAKASRDDTPDDTVVEDPSDILSASRRDELKMTGDWRYKKQFFKPPQSINCKPFASLPAMVKMGRKSSSPSNRKVDPDDSATKKAGNANVRETPSQTLFRPPSSVHLGDGLATECVASGSDQDDTGVIMTGNERRSEPDDSACGGDCCSNNDDSCVVKEDDSLSVKLNGELEVPSLYSMMKHNSCCYRWRHYDAPHRKGWSRWIVILQWTLWSLACAWHLSFAVLNIGASYQQDKVRGVLNQTFENLYPANYNSGAMCAWNETSPDADIRTFDSLSDVTDAGYTVIHCGECGSCSNWNDLSLQWTTRDELAQKARDW